MLREQWASSVTKFFISAQSCKNLDDISVYTRFLVCRNIENRFNDGVCQLKVEALVLQQDLKRSPENF